MKLGNIIFCVLVGLGKALHEPLRRQCFSISFLRSNYGRLSRVLDEWCDRVDRNRDELERTVSVQAEEVDNVDRYIEAGADHVMVLLHSPYALDPLDALVSYRDSLR